MARPQDQSTLIPGIASAVRDQIVLGKLGPGALIHQTELARSLGVSPVPLREALRRLEAEGLVTFLPYRGTIVSPIAPTEIQECYAGMLALYGVMLPKSLPKLRAEDFHLLRELAFKLDHHQVTLDEALSFYMILIQPAEMPLLMEMVRTLLLRATRLFSIVHANRLALQHVSPTRMELLDALESGDIARAVETFRTYHLIRQDGLLKIVADQP
ncbi:MAG TPA: GntR family transcriptional regulator [Holophagaceae bacterium]|nr:GntR family transcriptional regulator [Holophagaceae bacterium]